MRYTFPRRSNQSILKEISPGCSLEGMMLKLKLQYFGHVVRSVDSLEKTLKPGGIGGRRRRGRQRMRWGMASLTRWTRVWVNSGTWWWTGRPGMLWFMGLQRVRHDWVTELNWTELNHENKDVRGPKNNKTMKSEKQMNKVILEESEKGTSWVESRLNIEAT